jgi:hypothetical protein
MEEREYFKLIVFGSFFMRGAKSLQNPIFDLP